MGDQFRPWSPLEVEEQLHEVIGKMNNAVGGFYRLSQEYGQAKADLELAMAKAMLLARDEVGEDGRPLLTSAPDREAWALTRCEDEKRAFEILHARHDAQRRLLEVVRSQADVLRTLLVQARGVQDPRR